MTEGPVGGTGGAGLPGGGPGTAVRRALALIAVNPANGVQLPRKTTPEKFALTHDQVRGPAEAAGDLRTAIYVLGVRRAALWRAGRAAGGRCDVTRRRLKVSRSVTAVAKLGMVEGAPRPTRARSVPLPAFVMDMLAAAHRGPFT